MQHCALDFWTPSDWGYAKRYGFDSWIGCDSHYGCENVTCYCGDAMATWTSNGNVTC